MLLGSSCSNIAENSTFARPLDFACRLSPSFHAFAEACATETLGAYIETHLATQGHDPFYCHCIRTQFLNSGVNLETLPAAYVTLWLWEALPPPEQPLPLSRQKAAVMPEAV